MANSSNLNSKRPKDNSSSYDKATHRVYEKRKQIRIQAKAKEESAPRLKRAKEGGKFLV
jgi:hypothetical protein